MWMQLRPNRRKHLPFVADGIADDQPNREAGEERSDDRRNDKGEYDAREGVKSFVHKSHSRSQRCSKAAEMTALGSLLIILFRCCVILRRRRTIIQNGPGWSPSYRSFLDHRNNEAADQIARLLVSQIQGRGSPNRLRVRGYNCPFRLKSSHIAACADQAHAWPRRRAAATDPLLSHPDSREQTANTPASTLLWAAPKPMMITCFDAD